MSVFKRGNSWYISYQFQGRQIRKAIGRSKRVAETVLKDVEVKIMKGEYLGIFEDKKVLFKDYAAEYLKYSEGNKAKRSYQRDITSISVHLIPHFGGHYLASITTKMVQDFKTKRKSEANVATVNRELCCLSNMFRKAIDWGYLKRNPSKGVSMFKETPKEARWLNKEEIGRLLEECPPHIYALVATALNTGLRRMELFHLEWSDVDFKNETITVRNKEDWRTKNGESRTIPMNASLYGVLRKHPRRINSKYVFCNSKGKTWNDVRKSLSNAAKRAGIGHIGMHSLRHTFASQLVMAGVDLRTVQKWMGHKNIKTTMRYAHLAPNHERAAIEKLNFSTNSAHTPFQRQKSTQAVSA